MNDWPVKQLTKPEAAEILRGAAFTQACPRCGADEALSPHCPDCKGSGEGRTTVHSFLGGFVGADHDLDDALRLVDEADEIAWATHMIRHDLAVRVGDRIYRYDVPRPERQEQPA